jgi:hypothetical protein
MELALAAVHQYEQKIDTRTKFAASNGKLLFDLFRRRGWKLIEPEAGWTFLAYPPSAPPLGFQEDLANARLFVVPGEAFGQPGGFRFSVFAAPDKVQRAIQIISPVPADASPVVSETLLILAKSPLESKSRISAALGAPASRALAEAFLKDTFELAGQTGRRLDVAFTPAEAESCFRELAPTAKFSAQPEAEFGQRIHAALTRSLAGARNVVLIGTDTPHLPAAFIEQAFDALEESDLVLGPSTDGGFYLIGVKHCPAELFRNVEWSTSTVFETVESNARCLGLRMSTLDPWTDIDDLESLRSEAARIGATASAPHTREALQVLGIEASHVA